MSKLRYLISVKLGNDPMSKYLSEYGIDNFCFRNVDCEKSIFGEKKCKCVIIQLLSENSESLANGFLRIQIRAQKSIDNSVCTIFEGWIETENDFDRLMVMLGIK